MLDEVVEVSGALLLASEMGHDLDEAFGRKDSVSLHDFEFEVDPEKLVIHDVPVQELANFQERLLLRVDLNAESNFPYEAAEGLFLEVLFSELFGVSDEDIQSLVYVLFCKALCEHLVHEVVDFLYRVELLHLNRVALQLLLLEVSVLHCLLVLIVKDLVQLALLPPVFDIKVELAFSDALLLSLKFSPVRIAFPFSVSSKFCCLFFYFLSRFESLSHSAPE